LQRIDGRHVLVVVDNDPRYLAEPVIKEHHSTSGAQVIYLRSEPRNKSAALNAGIAAAPTEWLAFTDDDTEPDPDWLLRAGEYLMTTGVRVAGGRVIPGPVEGRIPPWLVAGASGRLPHGGVFVHYEPMSASGILKSSDPIPYGANVFVHKSVFELYGGYDEVLWRLCGKAALGVDDGEFGVRIQIAGEPIGYCHEALVVHPIHLERASVGEHLRIAYRYGWRDPLVFYNPRRSMVEWFRFRQIVKLSIGAFRDGLKGDRAGAVANLVDVAKNAGTLASRWSVQYRKWTQVQKARRTIANISEHQSVCND
jgi:GT2 family glycosyltransferase